MSRSAIAMPRTIAGTRTVAGSRQFTRDFGTCLSFDGATSDVTVNSQLFYQNTGYTVSFWINSNSTNSGRILALGNSANNNTVWTIQAQNPGNKIILFIRDDSNGVKANSIVNSLSVQDNEWHHVCMTDNNGTVNLYVDAVLDPTSWNYTRSGIFTIDRSAVGALVRVAKSSWIIGKVDDVRIWNNIVLTAQQVSNLCFTGINPSTPTSWYKYDEGSGSTAIDSGSLQANGTITGATYSTGVFIIPRTAVS